MPDLHIDPLGWGEFCAINHHMRDRYPSDTGLFFPLSFLSLGANRCCRYSSKSSKMLTHSSSYIYAKDLQEIYKYPFQIRSDHLFKDHIID